MEAMAEISHSRSRGRVLGCGLGRDEVHVQREGKSAQCQAISEPRGC